MLGWLFRIYGADRGPTAPWCRPVLWTWSCALFRRIAHLARRPLQRQALSRLVRLRSIAFPAAMLALWLSACHFTAFAWNSARNKPWSAHAVKIIGLAILLAVPSAIYVASSPGLYPAINPSHRRTHGREPARVLSRRRCHPADCPLRRCAIAGRVATGRSPSPLLSSLPNLCCVCR